MPVLQRGDWTAEELLTLGNQQDGLIEALLTLASSERGIEQKESFDLAAVAARALDVRYEEAQRREIHVETSLRDARVEGEPRLIEILVANLLDNALRHNVNGGRIDIATATTSKGATISVGNSGALVPFNEIERLFEPFQQLGDERIRHADGHGFGLAIVHAVANAHGATLDARVRLAGGVDVEVTFLRRRLCCTFTRFGAASRFKRCESYRPRSVIHFLPYGI